MTTATPTLTRLPGDADLDDVVAVIRRDGGVIIENIVDATTLDGLRADLLPILDTTPKGGDEFFNGTKTRRAGKLFGRTEHLAALALNPLYLGAAREILQAPVDIWLGERRTSITPDLRIGVTQAIQIRPGQGAQPLHRDDFVFLWRHPHFGREARLQIMLAVTDFTEENGGTLVIPGSHEWDDERMPRREEAISTTMQAGSALLWVGSVYHGGGQNNSTEPRTGLTMAYDLGTLRQEENMYLSLPRNVVADMPEELARLVGWTAGENFMGYVEIDGELADPYSLLTRDDYSMDAANIDTPS